MVTAIDRPIYFPRDPPAEPEKFAMWARQEFMELANALAGATSLRFAPQGAPPTKLREGFLAYADGDTWDPGSGAGLYVYSQGDWQYLGPRFPYGTLVPGRYYYGVATFSTLATFACNANQLVWGPLWIGRKTALTKLGCRVTTAAAAGKLVQVALYHMDGSIGTKVVSSGSMAADSTGIKEATIAVTVQPGLYATAVASDGAPVVAAFTDRASSSIFGTDTDNGAESVPFLNGTFGTWPDNPSVSYSAGFGTHPQVWVRA